MSSTLFYEQIQSTTDLLSFPFYPRCVASPPAPQPCDSHLDEQGYRECSKLLSEAFKPCHPFVHPTPYIDSCMSDHCASGGNMHVTCDSLRSYVTTCEVANVTLPPWWNDTACGECFLMVLFS